jgi:hypothetical protein
MTRRTDPDWLPRSQRPAWPIGRPGVIEILYMAAVAFWVVTLPYYLATRRYSAAAVLVMGVLIWSVITPRDMVRAVNRWRQLWRLVAGLLR